jgi:hypothetical protein
VWIALLLRRTAALPRKALKLLWRGVKAVGRGVRACYRGLKAPAGRLGIQVAATVLALIGALAAGWFIVPGAGPAWSFGTEPTTEAEEPPLVLTPEGALEYAPDPGLPADTEPVGDTATSGGTTASPSPFPSPTPTDAATTPAGATSLDAWAAGLASLGIPERALLAYGRAELVSAEENRGCNLSWTTLAGIGATETNHGSSDGNRIQSDGTTLTEIIGPIHAEMGPMQFLPSTWDDWKADGDKDGVHNPHDIDDAVTAAANYLCHGGRDMSTPRGWYDAVYSYNPRDDYVQKVFDRADEYGRNSTA